MTAWTVEYGHNSPSGDRTHYMQSFRGVNLPKYPDRTESLPPSSYWYTSTSTTTDNRGRSKKSLQRQQDIFALYNIISSRTIVGEHLCIGSWLK